MKAIVLDHYGPPADLEFRDIPKPEPADGEVLVKVHTTAVNDWEWGFVRGKPYIYRLLFGLRSPRVAVLGTEVAGVVEASGPEAARFRPGERVYGDLSAAGFGGFAEYVAVPESALAAMPDEMTFEQAASLPHASMLALQGLVDVGGILQGDRVLINGAGGGVGTFGVQIAKRYGAEVTGVDSASKLEAMRSIGFDHVLDYRQIDFTRTGERYDLILDAKTCRSPFRLLRALRPGGRYATVGGDWPRLLQIALLGPLIAKITGKRLRVVALKPNQGLETMNDMFARHGIQFLIEGPLPLSEVAQALQRFGEARHVGKIVISVSE